MPAGVDSSVSSPEPPTYASAALGYRTWLIDEGRLFSTGKGSLAWNPGCNRAYCENHASPHRECSCGLYAYHGLDEAQHLYEGMAVRASTHLPRRVFPVVGAVAFRGEVESHHDGLRGEEACILALALIPGAFTSEQEAEAQKIASDYGVPLLPFEELEEFAMQHALPVPEHGRGHLPTCPISLSVVTVMLSIALGAISLLGLLWGIAPGMLVDDIPLVPVRFAYITISGVAAYISLYVYRLAMGELRHSLKVRSG